MPRAIWKDTVIADSDATVEVEGNCYFPAESVDPSKIAPSTHETVCGWKGTANYYDVVVDGETNPQAAWYYANPKSEAANIAGHVAFWKGVTVEPS